MSDKARILRRCTHTLLLEVTHFRSLGIPYSQRSNGGGGSTEALTASAGQVSLPPLAFSLREPSGGVMVTWSVPGKNLGSPQERCWPNGLSAQRDAVLPVCSGTLTGSGLWPWCATVISASSSSRGDF